MENPELIEKSAVEMKEEAHDFEQMEEKIADEAKEEEEAENEDSLSLGSIGDLDDAEFEIDEETIKDIIFEHIQETGETKITRSLPPYKIVYPNDYLEEYLSTIFIESGMRQKRSSILANLLIDLSEKVNSTFQVKNPSYHELIKNPSVISQQWLVPIIDDVKQVYTTELAELAGSIQFPENLHLYDQIEKEASILSGNSVSRDFEINTKIESSRFIYVPSTQNVHQETSEFVLETPTIRNLPNYTSVPTQGFSFPVFRFKTIDDPEQRALRQSFPTIYKQINIYEGEKSIRKKILSTDLTPSLEGELLNTIGILHIPFMESDEGESEGKDNLTHRLRSTTMFDEYRIDVNTKIEEIPSFAEREYSKRISAFVFPSSSIRTLKAGLLSSILPTPTDIADYYSLTNKLTSFDNLQTFLARKFLYSIDDIKSKIYDKIKKRISKNVFELRKQIQTYNQNEQNRYKRLISVLPQIDKHRYLDNGRLYFSRIIRNNFLPAKPFTFPPSSEIKYIELLVEPYGSSIKEDLSNLHVVEYEYTLELKSKMTFNEYTKDLKDRIKDDEENKKDIVHVTTEREHDRIIYQNEIRYRFLITQFNKDNARLDIKPTATVLEVAEQQRQLPYDILNLFREMNEVKSVDPIRAKKIYKNIINTYGYLDPTTQWFLLKTEPHTKICCSHIPPQLDEDTEKLKTFYEELWNGDIVCKICKEELGELNLTDFEGFTEEGTIDTTRGGDVLVDSILDIEEIFNDEGIIINDETSETSQISVTTSASMSTSGSTSVSTSGYLLAYASSVLSYILSHSQLTNISKITTSTHSNIIDTFSKLISDSNIHSNINLPDNSTDIKERLIHLLQITYGVQAIENEQKKKQIISLIKGIANDSNRFMIIFDRYILLLIAIALNIPQTITFEEILNTQIKAPTFYFLVNQTKITIKDNSIGTLFNLSSSWASQLKKPSTTGSSGSGQALQLILSSKYAFEGYVSNEAPAISLIDYFTRRFNELKTDVLNQGSYKQLLKEKREEIITISNDVSEVAEADRLFHEEITSYIVPSSNEVKQLSRNKIFSLGYYYGKVVKYDYNQAYKHVINNIKENPNLMADIHTRNTFQAKKCYRENKYIFISILFQRSLLFNNSSQWKQDTNLPISFKALYTPYSFSAQTIYPDVSKTNRIFWDRSVPFEYDSLIDSEFSSKLSTDQNKVWTIDFALYYNLKSGPIKLLAPTTQPYLKQTNYTMIRLYTEKLKRKEIESSSASASPPAPSPSTLTLTFKSYVEHVYDTNTDTLKIDVNYEIERLINQFTNMGILSEISEEDVKNYKKELQNLTLGSNNYNIRNYYFDKMVRKMSGEKSLFSWNNGLQIDLQLRGLQQIRKTQIQNIYELILRWRMIIAGIREIKEFPKSAEIVLIHEINPFSSKYRNTNAFDEYKFIITDKVLKELSAASSSSFPDNFYQNEILNHDILGELFSSEAIVNGEEIRIPSDKLNQIMLYTLFYEFNQNINEASTQTNAQANLCVIINDFINSEIKSSQMIYFPTDLFENMMTQHIQTSVQKGKNKVAPEVSSLIRELRSTGLNISENDFLEGGDDVDADAEAGIGEEEIYETEANPETIEGEVDRENDIQRMYGNQIYGEVEDDIYNPDSFGDNISYVY